MSNMRTTNSAIDDQLAKRKAFARPSASSSPALARESAMEAGRAETSAMPFFSLSVSDLSSSTGVAAAVTLMHLVVDQSKLSGHCSGVNYSAINEKKRGRTMREVTTAMIPATPMEAMLPASIS